MILDFQAKNISVYMIAQHAKAKSLFINNDFLKYGIIKFN